MAGLREQLEEEAAARERAGRELQTAQVQVRRPGTRGHLVPQPAPAGSLAQTAPLADQSEPRLLGANPASDCPSAPRPVSAEP